MQVFVGLVLFSTKQQGKPKAASSRCVFVPGILWTCYFAVERQVVSEVFPLQSTY